MTALSSAQQAVLPCLTASARREASVRALSRARLRYTTRSLRVVPLATCCEGNGRGIREYLFESVSRLDGSIVGGAFAVAMMLCAPSASAIGPETYPITIDRYEDVTCPIGAPKNGRCVKVFVTVDAKNSKPAYNSEVFGRVRYPNGESALYGDFAEASDAGQVASLPEEISVKNNKGTLNLTLLPGFEDLPLDFVNFKARTYPGMRADFRVIAPVGFEEEEECENAAYGLPCDEEF